MSSPAKRLASLSLNLDNKWSYLKLHGDSSWRWFPTYFHLLVPRILNFLREHNLRVTVFLSGQDAAMPEHRDLIQAIAADGHEIANYSFNSEPWFVSAPVSEVQTEIARAEEQIEAASGYRPVGYRGPGFTISHEILQAITERGYLYDASTLPTHCGAAARPYRLQSAARSAEDDEQRSMLFRDREGRRPINPYFWQLGENELLEIPVTTLPGIRTPMHVSQIISLTRRSRLVAELYLRLGLSLWEASSIQPSLVLNALDFLSSETVPELGFLPTMHLRTDVKSKTTGEIINLFRSRYHIITLREHAIELSKQNNLTRIEPQYSWK